MRAVAEAPAKAIITGEHFVVHGAWALAAALPIRTRVTIERGDSIELISDSFPPKSPELEPARRVVEAVCKELSVAPRVKVKIASGIPHGAGLGSSASAMVAISSALAKFHSQSLGTKKLLALSMVGETEVHGRPSGIDPTICAVGGVILFRRGSRARRVTLEGPRRLLISLTGRTRSTKAQVSRVSELKEADPAAFRDMAESVSDLSLMASKRLASGDMRGLGRLLSSNQKILREVGVSTPLLDRLVEEAVALGAYGAKLTGAGGGGSAVAVFPTAKEKRIVSGLVARGFETFPFRVPVPGVASWLEP
jgi:mevalonate kinase